jgi:lipase chaperone LimK
VGSEATARLDALDQRRAAWSQRLAEYRSERDAIAADAQLDAQTREAAIEAARARHFDARERVRVRVIDEIDAAPSPRAF